jgi:FlaA1/EpsC-like NDP-sugar epimerase
LSDTKIYISTNFLLNVDGILQPKPVPPRFEPVAEAVTHIDTLARLAAAPYIGSLLQRYSRPIIFATDVALMAIAFIIAFVLRFDGTIPAPYLAGLRASLPWAVGAQTAAYLGFRLNQGMWRYIGMWDCVKIASSALSGAILFAVANGTYLKIIGVPLGIYALAPLLQTLFFVGCRLAKRVAHEVKSVRRGKRLLIFGAGDAGEMIVRDMKYNPYYQYTPVGFVDDDPLKTGRRIHGVRVLGTSAALAGIIADQNPDEVLIAMPSVGSTTVRDILKTLKGYPVPVKTLPDVWF